MSKVQKMESRSVQLSDARPSRTERAMQILFAIALFGFAYWFFGIDGGEQQMKLQQRGLTRPSQSSWGTASLFIAGCMFVGFLGSYLGGAFSRQPWYDDSPKPRLWPSQWVFPTVWIGNYTFMGLALWQIWRQRQRSAVAKPLVIFTIHLLHNFLFIPIVNHFKQKSVYVLMDTIGLYSGLVTTVVFARVSRIAKWLMLPYLGWLFFTTTIKVLWWRMGSKG